MEDAIVNEEVVEASGAVGGEDGEVFLAGGGEGVFVAGIGVEAEIIQLAIYGEVADGGSL